MVGRLLLDLQLGDRRTGKGWQRPLQHAGAVPGRDLQAQVLHEPGHDLIYIAVDAQVSVAVLRGRHRSGGGRGLLGAWGWGGECQGYVLHIHAW